VQRAGEDGGHRLLAIPSRERLVQVLRYLFDEEEFLSPHGIRALSRVHRDQPYSVGIDGETYRVDYVPGESSTGQFGGNSNWRGPVWFPMNYLLVEALERYHHFYGDSLQVECPTGSGRLVNLKEAAREISSRLAGIFLPDVAGRRPCHGDDLRYATQPHWKDLVLFYEYFHGETGRGMGASHQTGWTALAVRCVAEQARARGPARPGGGTAAPPRTYGSRRLSGVLAAERGRGSRSHQRPGAAVPDTAAPSAIPTRCPSVRMSSNPSEIAGLAITTSSMSFVASSSNSGPARRT